MIDKFPSLRPQKKIIFDIITSIHRAAPLITLAPTPSVPSDQLIPVWQDYYETCIRENKSQCFDFLTLWVVWWKKGIWAWALELDSLDSSLNSRAHRHICAL